VSESCEVQLELRWVMVNEPVSVSWVNFPLLHARFLIFKVACTYFVLSYIYVYIYTRMLFYKPLLSAVVYIHTRMYVYAWLVCQYVGIMSDSQLMSHVDPFTNLCHPLSVNIYLLIVYRWVVFNWIRDNKVRQWCHAVLCKHQVLIVWVLIKSSSVRSRTHGICSRWPELKGGRWYLNKKMNHAND